MLLLNGGVFGLRGRAEHAYLRVSQIHFGVYPVGHPYSGNKWVTIKDMADKTHQLGIHNTQLRGSFNRIPIFDENDLNDYGGMFSSSLSFLICSLN